jgi:hypothetical protein
MTDPQKNEPTLDGQKADVVVDGKGILAEVEKRGRTLGLTITVEVHVPHDDEKHVDIVSTKSNVIVFDGKTPFSKFMPIFKKLLVDIVNQGRKHKPVKPEPKVEGLIVPQKPKLILPD